MNQIAVLDFRGLKKASGGMGTFLADEIIDYLLREGRGITKVDGGLFKSDQEGVTLIQGGQTNIFAVVERSRLEQVLSEQGIGAQGLVNDAEAAQIGNLLGVQVILNGEITASHKDTRSKEEHYTYKDKKKVTYIANCVNRTVNVSSSIRVVDSSTGEILATRNTEKEAKDDWCDDSSGELRNVDEMIRSCASQIAWEFTNIITPRYQLEEFELEKIKTKKLKEKAETAAEAAEHYEIAKAYAIYHKLYESDPYNPKLLYNLGVLYEVTGDFEKANEMYEMAVSLKDEKKYKKALNRYPDRASLLSFYENRDIQIEPYDFEAAASDESLTAQKIKVKGKSEDRIDIFSESDFSAPVVIKVPGEIQLEVIATEGEWYLVKLLGGKQGYIHKSMTE